MTSQFKALTNHAISKHAKVERRTVQRSENVSLTDDATTVMTDLTRAASFSIAATASITRANDNMIACGVRLLFVTADNGDLVGIITSSDLLGEKPLQYITEHGGTRDDIIVKDIMTGKDSLEALRLDDVGSASVGDIIETMKTCNRQHMLVTKTDDDTQIETVCGIYSSTQIGRQLGIVIEPSPRVDTFAELEKALLLPAA
jgi:predicted transcriptional regulator